MKYNWPGPNKTVLEFRPKDNKLKNKNKKNQTNRLKWYSFHGKKIGFMILQQRS